MSSIGMLENRWNQVEKRFLDEPHQNAVKILRVVKVLLGVETHLQFADDVKIKQHIHELPQLKFHELKSEELLIRRFIFAIRDQIHLPQNEKLAYTKLIKEKDQILNQLWVKLNKEIRFREKGIFQFISWRSKEELLQEVQKDNSQLALFYQEYIRKVSVFALEKTDLAKKNHVQFFKKHLVDHFLLKYEEEATLGSMEEFHFLHALTKNKQRKNLTERTFAKIIARKRSHQKILKVVQKILILFGIFFLLSPIVLFYQLAFITALSFSVGAIIISPLLMSSFAIQKLIKNSINPFPKSS